MITRSFIRSRVARVLKLHRIMMVQARQSLASITQWIEPRVKRVVAALASCECCGDVAFARLCPDCRDKATPHISDDPYDVIGGEGGLA